VLSDIGRVLIILGIVLAAVGAVLLLADKIPFAGRLPGDIVIKKKTFTFYFPLATMLLVSLILTVVLNLIFRR
jgi:hypothetical protein